MEGGCIDRNGKSREKKKREMTEVKILSGKDPLELFKQRREEREKLKRKGKGKNPEEKFQRKERGI